MSRVCVHVWRDWEGVCVSMCGGIGRVYVCVEFEVYRILNWNSRKTPHFIPKF